MQQKERCLGFFVLLQSANRLEQQPNDSQAGALSPKPCHLSDEVPRSRSSVDRSHRRGPEAMPCDGGEVENQNPEMQHKYEANY